jgi:hypothetical protein
MWSKGNIPPPPLPETGGRIPPRHQHDGSHFNSNPSSVNATFTQSYHDRGYHTMPIEHNTSHIDVQAVSGGGATMARGDGAPPAWQRRRTEVGVESTSYANVGANHNAPPAPPTYQVHYAHQQQQYYYQNNLPAAYQHAPTYSHSNNNNHTHNNTPTLSTASSLLTPTPAPAPSVHSFRQPSTSSVVGPKKCVVRPEQYDNFLAKRNLLDMQQGTFVLAPFVPSSPPEKSSSGTVTVDLDLWNNYWADFSDQIASHEEAVQAFLQTQESVNGQEMGAGAGKINRRSVIVKIPSPLTLDAFLSQSNLFRHITHVAAGFGVLEYCRIQQDEVRLQFTTSTAAVLFSSFARSLDSSVLFPSNFLVPSAARGVPLARLHVFLLEQRPPLSNQHHGPTSSPTHCRRLILGKKLDIPSVFLNALFRDLFEAENIEYQNGGSFVLTFPSYQLCKYALHMLQPSFRLVFGLSLGYFDQKDVQNLDLV